MAARAGHVEDLDLPTIIAISALAYALANVVHEGLGHGVAAILLGARPTMFNASFFNYDETTVGDLGQRLISAAGSIVNVIVGTGVIALLRSRKIRSTQLRYFLWLFAAVNLLTAFGYLMYSGIGGIGDWARVVHDVEPQVVIRIVMAAIGGIFYFKLLPRWLMPLLDPFLGREPEARPPRARRLMLIPYLVGGCTLVAAGLFNPLGFQIVLISAAAASFGGTSLLAWYPAGSRPPSAGTPETALGIARSIPWIVASATLVALFVLVLGRGIGKV